MTQKEVLARDGIHFYSYVLNITLIRCMEFGALFLFGIAVCIYPFTNFDPKAWMIASIVLSILGIALLSGAQYWRAYAKKAFIAYDDDFFIVGNDPNAAVCIPWSLFTVQSAGLGDPKSGANLKMVFGQQQVRVRLYTGFVCIPHFDNVLYTLLMHIRDNDSPSKKCENDAENVENPEKSSKSKKKRKLKLKKSDASEGQEVDSPEKSDASEGQVVDSPEKSENISSL